MKNIYLYLDDEGSFFAVDHNTQTVRFTSDNLYDVLSSKFSKTEWQRDTAAEWIEEEGGVVSLLPWEFIK